jgi:hypothetical protein
MKRIIYIFVGVIILLLVGIVPVYAHGGVNFGIGIGIGPVWPFWGPPYYPYYYQQQPVVIQQQAPVYEQQAPQGEAPQYFWYYCQEANAYYPYVKQCPGGWMKVVPTPGPPKER